MYTENVTSVARWCIVAFIRVCSCTYIFISEKEGHTGGLRYQRRVVLMKKVGDEPWPSLMYMNRQAEEVSAAAVRESKPFLRYYEANGMIHEYIKENRPRKWGSWPGPQPLSLTQFVCHLGQKRRII